MPSETRDEAGYSLIPANDDESVITACAEIIIEEWKRSLESRISVLKKSSPALPQSLAMLSPDKVVIGHSRLLPVLGQKRSCLVVSVVVPKSMRGQGLGRRLMTLTECYAKSLDYETMYLTTHDKQGFYERLGYGQSESVATLGNMSADSRFAELFESMNKSDDDKMVLKSDLKKSEAEKVVPQSGAPSAPPAPPPPPPPPPKPQSPPSTTWYKKSLN